MDDSIPNIWQMQTEKDSAGLIRALQHTDPEIRRRAAVSLRIIGDTDAIDSLREVLESEADPRVRVAVIAALDHLAPQKTDTGTLIERSSQPQSRVERLIEHLMSNRPQAAIQAANALGDLGDKIAVPPLIILFRNKRQPASVRLAAAESLLKMESAPAEVTLLAALRSEKWHLRRNGAAILGQLQADWAVGPLAKAAAYDDHPHVIKTAKAALKRIGTPEALNKLASINQRHKPAPRTEAVPPELLRQARQIAAQETIPNRPQPKPPKPDKPAGTPPAKPHAPANKPTSPPPSKIRKTSYRRKSATQRLDDDNR